jgi:oligopeptide/dipeptide ABC transporter ATP-binding protein
MAPIVRVEHLVKHFPLSGSSKVVQAVNDVSFSIEPGETLGLVGESGSGKTTVGRCILRLIEPTAGRVIFEGRDLNSLSDESMRVLRPRLQLVFQEPFESLDPRMTIAQILEEPLRLHTRLSRRERGERTVELLTLVGLRRRIVEYYPHQLAAGQQQRVGIARAIATHPSFIVLDEPVSSLDPTARAEIIDLLIELQERLGMAYLFISHDLTTVKYLCTWTAVMYLGKIVEMSPTEELFEQPSHPYTRALLSAVPFPDPDIKHEKYVLSGEIPSPINLPSGCHLHTRCPAAVEACSITVPVPIQVGDAHWASCIRVHELRAERGWTHELTAQTAV